jgi:hypothetical protein
MKIRTVALWLATSTVAAHAAAQQPPAPPPEGDAGPEAPAATEPAAETPPEAPPADTPAPAPAKKPDSANDAALMAELEAAASTDESALQKSRGSAALYFEQQAQDPANLLGKEVIGNETNPSISIILDMAFGYFSSDDRVRMGGHAPTTNGPFIQNAELAASAPIDPFFRIDLAHSLNHGHVEEVYLTTTALPWNLQFRGGKFKSQIGRHNPTHLHTWDFAVHPLPNQFLFGGEGLTLPGAELSVLLPLPWYVELIGALQTGEAGAFRTKSTDHGAPVLEDFVYPLRLVQFLDVGDDWGLQLGLNAVHGTSSFGPEQGNRSEAYGADLFLKWRPIGYGNSGFVYVKWTAEAWTRAMQVPNDLWRDSGGYTDLTFGLSKEWNAGLRGELWRRTSGENPNATNGRSAFGVDVERGSAQVSYMPSHFSRVRLQYSAEHAEELGVNHTGLLQLEVAAGAHGAHTY